MRYGAAEIAEVGAYRGYRPSTAACNSSYFIILKLTTNHRMDRFTPPVFQVRRHVGRSSQIRPVRAYASALNTRTEGLAKRDVAHRHKTAPVLTLPYRCGSYSKNSALLDSGAKLTGQSSPSYQTELNVKQSWTSMRFDLQENHVKSAPAVTCRGYATPALSPSSARSSLSRFKPGCL